MTRYLPKMLLVAAVLVALTSGAWAQGWGMGRGRWANVSPDDAAKLTDLHQKVREAQWKLWQLRSDEADKKAIEKQTKEVLRLREQMSKLTTTLPAGPCFQADPNGTPPAAGQRGWFGRGQGRGMRGMGAGRGWCGGRGMGAGRGWGGGRGMGMGGGRGMGRGGWCPWLSQTPAAQPDKSE